MWRASQRKGRESGMEMNIGECNRWGHGEGVRHGGVGQLGVCGWWESHGGTAGGGDNLGSGYLGMEQQMGVFRSPLVVMGV